MKRILFMFMVAILVLGTIMDCGKSENKYVGKYVSEQTVFDPSSMKQVHQILEIKKDGTWAISPGGSGGEWKIDEDGIVLYIEKTRIPHMIGQIEGKKLINRLHGETFAKQN